MANYLNQAQLDDQDSIDFATQFLRGEALVWWLSIGKESKITSSGQDEEEAHDESRIFRNWEQFQHVVRKEFKPLMS